MLFTHAQINTNPDFVTMPISSSAKELSSSTKKPEVGGSHLHRCQSTSAVGINRKRKREQTSRKSTAPSSHRSSPPVDKSQVAALAELDRLKFSNPGRQNVDLNIEWNHGSLLTRGFKRQLTQHSKLLGRKWVNASIHAYSLPKPHLQCRVLPVHLSIALLCWKQ